MARIGVFVCHCGLNIAGTVDVERVIEAVRDHPDVVHAADYKYLCSDPGQSLIQDAIETRELDGVVVAACSPSMHEATFGRAAAEVSLNPYRLEIANIREQVSWPHQREPEAATRKAIEVVRTLVEKVSGNEELSPLELPITRRALVVGGGIAGMTAALDIGDAGYPVLLVERSERLGGHMAEHSQLYLNLDAGDDLLRQRVEAVHNHPHVEVLTGTQVVALDGYVGNFTAQVRADYIGNTEEEDGDTRHEDVGAIVLATGFDLYDKGRLPEYGGDRYPDVVDSLQFESMLRDNAVRRPSDGRVPEEVVWVQCAGSRDPEQHQPYCSKICCMYVAKQIIAYRRAVPQGQAYVFYIDIRAAGKGYDEFTQRAMEDERVVYVRGKVSRLFRRQDRVVVLGADTLTNRQIQIAADLVVVAPALRAHPETVRLAEMLGLPTDRHGWLLPLNDNVQPVHTVRPGIFVAGTGTGPMDIPETVAHASGAAAQVLKLFRIRDLS